MLVPWYSCRRPLSARHTVPPNFQSAVAKINRTISQIDVSAGIPLPECKRDNRLQKRAIKFRVPLYPCFPVPEMNTHTGISYRKYPRVPRSINCCSAPEIVRSVCHRKKNSAILFSEETFQAGNFFHGMPLRKPFPLWPWHVH